MDVLRTAVSALAAFDPETADKSPRATLRKGVRLTAQVPMIVAAHERIRNGTRAGGAGSRPRRTPRISSTCSRARSRAKTPRG